jgi:hypothetical protein
VRLMQSFDREALVFLPVCFAVRAGTKLPVRDFSVQRQTAVAIQTSYVVSPRH